MDWLTQELRLLGRRFRQAPLFAAITILTLALGIGGNTAIFAVINAVLLKPLAYSEPDRLVAVWHTAPGVNITDLNSSPSTYFTYREENRTFSSIALWRDEAVTLTNPSQDAPDPERVDSLVVTSEFFPLLGVPPLLGRLFTPTDDAPGRPATVILTHEIWQRKYGADPHILGRRILLDARPHEVIAVLPASFRFMNLRPGVVVPFQLDRGKVFLGNFSHQSVARLKPGVTLAQASADVARMLPLMLAKFPPPAGLNPQMFINARIAPNLRWLKDDLIGDIGRYLWVLMAAIGIVLFIACANVANLLLVRVEGRSREIAVRAALGSTRSRLAADLLLESTALGLLGGFLGIAFAYAALQLLQYLAPPYLPRLEEIRLDPLTLLFAFLLSLAAGIFLGLLPVFRNLGSRLQSALRSGGRSMTEGRERQRARNTLVVVQVALAVVLLIGAGLMIRTLSALRSVQPGFTAPHEIMTFRVSIPAEVAADAPRLIQLFSQISSRLAAIPGVRSVGLTNSVTMDNNQSYDPIYAEGRQYAEGSIPVVRRFKRIGPHSFQTMGNPLKAGRDLTWTDIQNYRPYVLLSENLATEFFGSPAAAIGKRIRESPRGAWREVIGVVGNERDNGVHLPAPTTVYWPFVTKDLWNQNFDLSRSLAFTLRTSRTGTAALMDDIRRAVWGVNPSLPIANPRSVETIYARSFSRTSFTLTMLSLASALALLLGLIGIYGVIAYSIAQRSREIGIRLALGSPESSVRQLFLAHGLKLALLGALIGLAIAIPLGSLLRSLLFEVSTVDPLTYLLAASTLLAASALAAYLPTRRATRVSPVDALRAD